MQLNRMQDNPAVRGRVVDGFERSQVYLRANARYCTNMHDVLPSLRRARIAERLEGGAPVAAADLAAEFGMSEDAIRRDLRALAAEGRCRRTYGGALPLSPASAPMLERAAVDQPRKRALALAAARLIQPGQVVFLDNGSTNLALAAVLSEVPGLTVVTNAVLIAAELMRRPGVRTILIGGTIDRDVGGCVDARALIDLRRLAPDCCFLGTCALSEREGLAAFHHADAVFKRELVRRSRTVAAMIATEKLDTRAPYGIAPLGALGHLVVEHDMPAAARARLAAAGPAVVVADRVP
jgi:DeoR/GlpR family transcriptional regulator of sugar metabolism